MCLPILITDVRNELIKLIKFFILAFILYFIYLFIFKFHFCRMWDNRVYINIYTCMCTYEYLWCMHVYMYVGVHLQHMYARAYLSCICLHSMEKKASQLLQVWHQLNLQFWIGTYSFLHWLHRDLAFRMPLPEIDWFRGKRSCFNQN